MDVELLDHERARAGAGQTEGVISAEVSPRGVIALGVSGQGDPVAGIMTGQRWV